MKCKSSHPSYVPKKTKSILNKMKNIDGWFWCRYSLNPYSGCEHGCIYCDGRSSRYYMHDDFETTIYYKENAAQLLEKKLKNSRSLLPDIIAAGGTCDTYQPAEKTFKITQKILKIIDKYNWPVGISTKNELITRDSKLFESIGKKTYAAINFSFSTADDNIAQFFEPGASTPTQRLSAIKMITTHTNNVHVGINFMPIIPLIEDSKDQLKEVIEKVAESGAKYVLFSPFLTMRDNQKTFFLKKLKKYCFEVVKTPQIYHKFINIFVKDYSNVSNYMKLKSNEIINLCSENNLAIRAPRWIPNDYRKQNYLAGECLLNEYYLRMIIGKNSNNLMWAAHEIHNLDKSLGQLKAENNLINLKNLNKEVYSLIKKYIKEPNSLDFFMKKKKLPN